MNAALIKMRIERLNTVCELQASIVAFHVACGIASGKTPSTPLQRSTKLEVYLRDPTLVPGIRA
ncbi:hypothetical protein, partial [Bradyrhizobium liaoningense]|uniref:hypothetical protein n=1 Tax=Bradyrhizobium liaoningense TaxID=43992 RepID=UPI001AEC3FFD